MKASHKLFFAIPFDSATKNLYENIRHTIRNRYPTITTVIGNQEIGPSPGYSDIASFKAQNRELTKQFVYQIRDADIVIADLTHNNPNVHVELGIALTENKNILRVTGRSVTELGFDIRNLEVHQYKDEAQLTKTIADYLDIFLEIKKLPITNQFSQLYFKEPGPIKLRSLQKKTKLDVQSNCPPSFKMRDGAVKAEFEILDAETSDDWFGIYFRVGVNFLMGGYLVYVRQNGSLEIAVYPGPQILQVDSIGQSILGRQVLTVEFENDYVEAHIGSAQLKIVNLSNQIVGHVFPATWNADVDLHSFEMICRDTIEMADP
jgi:hypothetical protein